MTPNTTQSATVAANAADHLLNPIVREVAEHIGLRGAMAAANPAFRKYGSHDTLITGRSARRMATGMFTKSVKKAGHREQLL